MALSPDFVLELLGARAPTSSSLPVRELEKVPPIPRGCSHSHSPYPGALGQDTTCPILSGSSARRAVSKMLIPSLASIPGKKILFLL